MKKIGRYLLCLVPLAVYIAMQLIMALGGSMVAGAKAALEAPGADVITMQTRGIEIYMEMVPFILLLTHAAVILISVFWVFLAFRKRKEDIGTRKLGMRAIPAILLLGIGVQYLCHGALSLINAVDPEILSGYGQMMENVGLGTQNIFSIIAAVCLAPIGEEVLFRLLTLDFAKRAGASFWVANVIQAVCFGIAHLNLVQGIYAFFMGIVLGWIYEKYHSLAAAILVHVIINFAGTVVVPAVGSLIFGEEGLGFLASVITILLAAAVTVGGVLLSGKVTAEKKCTQ